MLGNPANATYNSWYLMPDIRNTIVAGHTNGWGLYKDNNGANPATNGVRGIVQNNLFYGNHLGDWRLGIPAGSDIIDVLEDNITGEEPLFMAVSPEWYALDDESPAIGNGVSLWALGVKTDILNQDRSLKRRWDMGVYGHNLNKRGTLIILR